MQLTQTGQLGQFEITATGENFTVIGTPVNAWDIRQKEYLIDNLAEMLEEAISYVKDNDMVDNILDIHGLVRAE